MFTVIDLVHQLFEFDILTSKEVQLIKSDLSFSQLIQLRIDAM